MRPIIAFAGLMGSGKTTAAMHLCNEHNFRRIRFAGPLKDMMEALGLTRHEIDGELKEQPCALLGGKTPRFAMQTIGMEWGREMITPGIWVNAWRRAVNAVPEGVGVVVDDCRFPNEAIAIRSASPVHMIVRIARVGAAAAGGSHPSELQTFRSDIAIMNDGTVEELLNKVDELVLKKVAAS